MHPDKWAKHFTETVNAGLDGQVAHVTVGETPLECIIASVQESRAQGLSDHAELPHDGMIFIYEGDHTAKFHRRSMSMDISIWFFDAQGNLVGSGWTDDEATASKPYRYVIETRPDIQLEGQLRINQLAGTDSR